MKKIVPGLDVPKVLSRPDTCAGLRSLFAWCSQVLGDVPGERFQLASGGKEPITAAQLERLTDKL